MLASCGEVVGVAWMIAASPASFGLAGATNATPSVSSSAVRKRFELGVVEAPAGLAADREQQRAVEARAEPLAELVVCDPLGLVLRQVAVVRLAEAQVGERQGEHDEQEAPGDDGDPRATDQDPAPPLEAGGPADARRVLRLEPAGQRAGEDRQHCDRRDDDEGDGDRRADAHLADQRDADGEQAGDRHHDDEPRRHHRYAGSGVRARGRLRRGVACGELLAEAAEDEQRVVDAGAEAEHDRDRRRELGDAKRLGDGGQDELADQHAGQRAQERDGHGCEGAEQGREQHDRDRDAGELADRHRRLGGDVDRLAAQLDPGAAVLGPARGLLERLAVLLLEFCRLDVVLDGRERGTPVL